MVTFGRNSVFRQFALAFLFFLSSGYSDDQCCLTQSFPLSSFFKNVWSISCLSCFYFSDPFQYDICFSSLSFNVRQYRLAGSLWELSFLPVETQVLPLHLITLARLEGKLRHFCYCFGVGCGMSWQESCCSFEVQELTMHKRRVYVSVQTQLHIVWTLEIEEGGQCMSLVWHSHHQ